MELKDLFPEWYSIIDPQFNGQRITSRLPAICNGLDTNHWVLICGARHAPAEEGIITGEVLVSCSVRGEHWHEARDFLKTMGGYDVLFVRPVKP